ncbi:MAG TPA: AcvB/VirJ family lysyl-phosphatidylglycerol hydrolase [Steroidobacteraceae bacterium]|nr:AcvB/VirJ family lysyl-phosphatidylglycerol hydrolase [Steroidobacteraceae bacterium]
MKHPRRSNSAWAILLVAGGIVCATLCGAAPAPGPTPKHSPQTIEGAQRLSHGRFKNVAIYAPDGTPTSFVLFLSGDGGWNPTMAEIARRLASHGAMVAGIDLPKFRADLEADDADCVFPDGDLENLSHFLQAYYHLPTYLTPFFVGYGAGATLAYATLVQAPANTFAGALTLGFCPASSMRKPLCKGSGVDFTPRPGRRGVDYLPARQLANPWVLLQGELDQACASGSAGAFIANMPGAALAVLPKIGPTYQPAERWLPKFLAAFDTLVQRSTAALTPPAPADLGDLPVVEVPAQPAGPAPPGAAAQSGAATTDVFAIILSGDGGWAGLDKDVALALSAHGIPVVGLDSLRYFWSARTPDGLAADLDHMIRYYGAHLNKKRVLLIGYSQGADVLPFAVNRLPAATRARVALTALMGMSEHALFEFHVSSWVSNDTSGPATMPEVNRISGVPVLCVYGEDESDSLCPTLDPKSVRIVKRMGGHHFDGDYAGLARDILASVNR